MFFFWSFATGGLWVVRPLFAYETGGTFLLVALISSVSAMPRVIVGPLTGYLTDRYGRLPFIVLGSVISIVAMVGDFFIDRYYQFLLLEVLGGIGISAWMTSANILMADSTQVATRGRAVAVREISSRVGLLLGPMVAGFIGLAFGLRYIFLFIAAAKLVVIVITVLWIKETHERRAGVSFKLGSLFRWHVDVSMFRTRAFLALSIGTMALGLVIGGTGVFRTLFPAHMREAVGLDEAQIGFLISLSGLLALLGSMPVGMASDRFGRKRPLILGLLLTGVATYLMSGSLEFTGAAIAVIVFGLAEAMGNGTIQVYAMDLAPEERRGEFIGVWFLFMTMGQITGPLVIGLIADRAGFAPAFTVVTVMLVVGAIMVGIFGKETAGRGAEKT